MDRRVFVYSAGSGFDQPVGRLWMRRRSGRESATFLYDPAWLEWPGRYALEPALALDRGPHHAGKGQFGSFADSAPDRWGRMLLQRAEGREACRRGETPRVLGEADFLLGVSDEARQGALRFREELDGPFLAAPERSIPPFLQLPRLLAAASRIEARSEGEEDLGLLLAPGSSLGGARPKAAVRDREGSLSIAKFPRSEDDWNVPAWEAVAHRIARRAEIRVPDSQILRAGGQDVFLVRRFDRHGAKRIPFLSAMTMLEADDREPRTYPEIAEALRRWGAAPARDLRELWKRIVLGVLISNRDDHLRNHGFLQAGPAGWRLSPAYDLNPVPADAGGGTLATMIVEGDDRADPDLALQTAVQYGISQPEARRLLAGIAAAVVHWRKDANRFGIDGAEQERMASAFRAG